MAIKTHIQKLSNGNSFKYVKKGYALGKKLFLKEGFKQCNNPMYMEKGKKIVHYNKIMKVWLVEEK